MPEQVPVMLREAPAAQTPEQTPEVSGGSSGSGSPSRRLNAQVVDPGFARGEKVQVWSDSKQLWLGGVVKEVFLTDGKTEDFCVPAGSLKVSSEAGIKWIHPALAAQVLRKVGCGSTV